MRIDAATTPRTTRASGDDVESDVRALRTNDDVESAPGRGGQMRTAAFRWFLAPAEAISGRGHRASTPRPPTATPPPPLRRPPSIATAATAPRLAAALDRVRQQRPRTRRRAAVFICGVDVDDERPRCACDVLSATPSPRTTVRLATTPRSTSALCVIATTSSRRPRPSSPTTTSYALTSRCVYLRRRRRRPNDLAVRVTCCLRHCRRVRPCVWRRRPVLRALCA